MTKVLLIGGNGMLGSKLYMFLKEKKIKVQKFNKRKINFTKLNYKNFFSLKNKYDIIIFLSAITNVDLCEKKKKLAKKVNFLYLKYLIKSFESFDKKPYLIFLSTDQFYSNYKNNSENNNACKNFYTKTKLWSEKILFQNYKNHSIILRTNFFGKSLKKKKESITDFIFNNLKNKKKIYMTDDIFFSPVSMNTLCKILFKIIMRKKKYIGKYNIGSKNGMSKYNFSVQFANQVKLNTNLISLVKYKNLNFFAKRPKDMRMKLEKMQNKLNIKAKSLVFEIKNSIHEYK